MFRVIANPHYAQISPKSLFQGNSSRLTHPVDLQIDRYKRWILGMEGERKLCTQGQVLQQQTLTGNERILSSDGDIAKA